MRRLSMIAVCLAALLSGVAQGAPFVYEGLQYPPGPLAGRGPALGFAGPWNANPGVTVVAAGLSSPLALPSTGGAVEGFFDYIDPLGAPLVPSPGREFWASFLLFHSGPNDQTYMGLSPAGAPLGAPPAVGFGVRLGQYGIFVGGAFTGAPTPFSPPGFTDLLVTHFVASGGAWVVSLFVNPVSFAVPDLIVNVPSMPYQTMVNQNQAEFESDEFRLGDHAGDVAAAGTSGLSTGGDLQVPRVATAIRGIFPNPIRSEGTIQYEAPRGARARLDMLDVLGRTVATLCDNASNEETRSVRWNATDRGGRRVSAGVYYLRLASGGIVRTASVVVSVR